MLRRITTQLSLLLFSSLSLAQEVVRPRIPEGGLKTRVEQVQVVSYSDGHSALGAMILPDHPTPGHGWPLLVRVHSLGADRTQALAWRRHLASQGFAVWTYDVRGHASARGAAQTMWRGQERFDLAEQLAHLRSAWQGKVDSDRIAVIGRSQGGVHAWGAAADSERRVEVGGRGVINMPRIRAVVAGDFVADPAEQRLRDGTAFSSFSIEVAAPGAPRSFALDPSYIAMFRRAFLAQDPVQLARELHQKHGRVTSEALADTKVPILYFHAYRDLLCGPELGLRALRGLPASTPWRALLTSVGHGTPHNRYEDAFRRKQSIRWLTHFLWSEDNGVEEEAQIVRSRLPEGAEGMDPAHLMGHEFVRRGGANLYRPLDFALKGREAELTQTVSPGYTPQSYFDNPFLRQTPVLLAAIPLAEKVYQFPVTTEALQIGDRGRVHLTLTPDSDRFSVAVVLSARFPGSSSSVMLASRGRTVLNAVPFERLHIDLDLLPTAMTLPAGTVLELSVRNLWLREAPMERLVEVAPLFHNFSLLVHHGESVLTLPVRTAEPMLVSSVLDVCVREPEFVPMQVRAGAARRGETYTVLAGLSGHSLPGSASPLRFDALTYAVLQMSNAPALPGFVGTLDADGRAEAGFDFGLLPPIPALLIGREMSFAVCVLGHGMPGSEDWSSPVDVLLR